jgi:hypothetical protein
MRIRTESLQAPADAAACEYDERFAAQNKGAG